MKLTFPSRAMLAAVILGGVTIPKAFAADATNAATHPVPPASRVDNDDMAKLVKVREQVLAAHPDLKAEEEKLKAMHEAQAQNPPAVSATDRDAAFAEWKTYQKKMRAEMLKIDPTLAPVFAKLDESRQHGSPAPFQPASAK